MFLFKSWKNNQEVHLLFIKAKMFPFIIQHHY